MRAGRRSSGIAAPFTPFLPSPPSFARPLRMLLGTRAPLWPAPRTIPTGGILDTGGTMPPGLADVFVLALGPPLAFSVHPPRPFVSPDSCIPPMPEADLRQPLLAPPDTLSPLGVALFPQWRHCADGLQEPLAPLGRAPACRLLDPCGSSGSVALAIPQE